MKLATDVGRFCATLPAETTSHEPRACDAVYALQWRTACTGCANAAVALLRANGIPARVLLNAMVGATGFHYIIDYYVPGTFAKESDDGQTVRSGYGERLMSFRGIDQLSNVIRLLRERGTTRRAVIQLFDASDLTGSYTSIAHIDQPAQGLLFELVFGHGAAGVGSTWAG